MKIVFMTSGTVTSSISYRALSFAKELVKKGHEVYVFALRFDKYSNFKDENISSLDGVHIIRPLQTKGVPFEVGLVSYIFSSIFLLLKIHPNIVHIYKANPITITGLLCKWFRKSKVYFDTDDLDSEVMKVEKNLPFKILLTQVSEKILLKYSNVVIVGSRYLANLYHKQYSKKTIVRIPNGGEFDIKWSKSTGKKRDRIVFIGNINRKSILEPLFLSLHSLITKSRGLTVEIIGSGIFLNYFKILSRKLEIANFINFRGFTPHNQLDKYILPGDIGYCYMPNEETTKACSSMKVFEYMRLGAIPVVSNIGDLPLYVALGKAGYIAKHSNPESLIKTLRYAISHKKETGKKESFMKNFGPKNYSWNKLTGKLEKVYKKYYL